MERVKGIEPSSQPWEGHILPLNHTRIALIACNKESVSWQFNLLPVLIPGPQPKTEARYIPLT